MFEEPKGLTESEVGELSKRLTELGLQPPSTLCILPTNVLSADTQDALFFAVTAPDLKVLFRRNRSRPIGFGLTDEACGGHCLA